MADYTNPPPYAPSSDMTYDPNMQTHVITQQTPYMVQPTVSCQSF